MTQYNQIKWKDSERFVYSPTHNYCGTLDATTEEDGYLLIWDFKTSVDKARKKTPDHEGASLQRLQYAAQMWAYMQALIEEGVYPEKEIRRRILRIDKLKGTAATPIDLDPEEGKDYWKQQLRSWNEQRKEIEQEEIRIQ